VLQALKPEASARPLRVDAVEKVLRKPANADSVVAEAEARQRFKSFVDGPELCGVGAPAARPVRRAVALAPARADINALRKRLARKGQRAVIFERG
jgi:hypothetical protein